MPEESLNLPSFDLLPLGLLCALNIGGNLGMMIEVNQGNLPEYMNFWGTYGIIPIILSSSYIFIAFDRMAHEYAALLEWKKLYDQTHSNDF